jgi:hypothetical protein
VPAAIAAWSIARADATSSNACGERASPGKVQPGDVALMTK